MTDAQITAYVEKQTLGGSIEETIGVLQMFNIYGIGHFLTQLPFEEQ